MSGDGSAIDRDARLTALLAELAESAPAAVSLSRTIVRRARRQRAVLTIVQLLVVVARTVPDAIALGAGRRR